MRTDLTYWGYKMTNPSREHLSAIISDQKAELKATDNPAFKYRKL